MGNSASNQRRDGEGPAFEPLQEGQDAQLRTRAQHERLSLRLTRRRTDPSHSRTSRFTQTSVTDTTGDQGDPLEQSQTQPRRHDGEGAGYEHDERPLFEPGTNNFSRSRQVGSIGRSPSTMSRLGSRLLPESVMRNLLLSGEETAEEGEALRQGVASRRRTSVWERRAPSLNNERFSIGGTIRRHMESRTETRRRSIRGPFPLGHSEHQLLQGESANSLGLEDDGLERVTERQETDSTPQQRTRFSRMRNSLSLPIASLFGSLRERQTPRHMPRSPTPHPGHASHSNDSDHLLPRLPINNVRTDMDDSPHELDAVEPEARNLLSSSRITSGMSTIRRIPHGFRSRSRLIRRGEHPPLSQVLQLAAAAIAAQLGGQSGPGSDGLRTLGGEAFDGSIQNFVQTLQDAASAQAGEDIDINATDGELPPVNFMRVFQFPNDENGSPIPHAQAHDTERTPAEPGNTMDGDRSVTLVLVGVRSMPHARDSSAAEQGGIGPSLDTLLSLPFLPPATMVNGGSSGALLRRTDTRTRTSRRHSLTNFNFPAQYESQRHHRVRPSASRLVSDQNNTTPNHHLATPVSESPPGPNPPPSTPADIRSGHATPIRRPSSASGVHTPSLPDLEEDHAQGPASVSSEQSASMPRQRRRSDSEFARRPELGSGAARRNGMVEPDRPAIGSGRSWLIYVVGTNVSPDHPAFTMPSLFTDNPTYEDMQMLSTLLGPVKPPVASQEDINLAGGIYRLAVRDHGLVAEPVCMMENGHVLTITKGDRCLICLCDYEAAEDVRQLDSCRHMFHRECIDEWLTTGRNSCPMCRGQGVKETPANARSVTTAESNTT